jgi:hypothetical protein
MRIATKGAVTIGEKNYALNQDFFPLSSSVDKAKVTGELVLAGFGIQEPGKRMDFDSAEVKGKIAAINLGSPDGVHPHSAFLKWHGIDVRVKKAVEKGAIGVIFYGHKPPIGELAKTKNTNDIPVIYMNSMDGEAGQTATIDIDILSASEFGHNVVGFIDRGKENTVVIGAHHDHLGLGEISGSLEPKTGFVHNGADDNASGVAAMIQLACSIKKYPKKYGNNNYLFIAFSGEEMGLVGSKYFVANPTIDLKSVNYMLNMDMVGMLREDPATLVINGVGTSPAFTPLINSMDETITGIDTTKTTESGIGASDHTAFYLADIPAIHFFTGQHEHYHKSTDDVEHLNLPGEVRVIQYIESFMAGLDEMGRLEFTKTTDEDKTGRMRFKVTLGVIPDYVFAGEGMRVDGVKTGKTADKAGMIKGDIIVNMDGQSIKSIHDYMKVLTELDEGSKCKIVVNRDGEFLTLNATF